MAWESSNVTPQIAVERGWVTWDVYLSNWGRTDSGDLNALLFPNPASQATIPSINGVAIGPYSDFDRVKIQFNPNIDIPTSSLDIFLNLTTQKLLSIESPITYPLGGPISVVADIDASIGDSPGETFIADDGLNTVTGFDFAGVGVAPRLHLTFFLQNAVIQPLRRYPKNFSGVLSLTAGTTLRRVLPILGRKQGRITFNNAGPDTATLRIGLIGPRDRVNDRQLEQTLTNLTIVSGATESFTFGGDIHDTQFLSVWSTVAVGETSVMYFNMEFTDVPGGGCTCINVMV